MGGISGVSPLRVKGPSEYVVVKGSFAPNGGSAIDATKNKGRGFSVARTGAGLFLITFEQVGYDLVSMLKRAAGGDSPAGKDGAMASAGDKKPADDEDESASEKSSRPP